MPKKKLTFTDYLRFREGLADDNFGMDEEGGDIEKLNHFMLLALADQDIRGSLYPILQQIAGQDETGEMQDLLKRIDINSLGRKAKKMLKSKMRNKDDTDDGPTHTDDEKMNRMDMVKPSNADTGRGLEGGDEGGGQA